MQNYCFFFILTIFVMIFFSFFTFIYHLPCDLKYCSLFLWKKIIIYLNLRLIKVLCFYEMLTY